MKIVVAPDSFKGSLSAQTAANAMASGVRRVLPDARVRCFPLADGGEGTLDILLLATGGQRRTCVVHGAGGGAVTAAYGVIQRQGQAVGVLEAAQAVGFLLAETAPVAQRTSFGVGELMRVCLDAGLRQILIAIGGTSTNDGGSGVLTALGVRLLDTAGEPVAPTPAGLAALARLDFSGLDARLQETEITILSDVVNPLCGPHGASAVFGPQKGVLPEEVAEFDARLARLAALGDAWLGREASREPGTGAAGGIGYALQLLGGRHLPGAAVIAEFTGLEDAISQADWVLTGEGKADLQTLHGKAPYVVAQLAARHRVPVMLLAGRIDASARDALMAQFSACFALCDDGAPDDEAMRHGQDRLADLAAQAMRAALRA